MKILKCLKLGWWMGQFIPLTSIASGNVTKDLTFAGIFLVQCVLERFENVPQRIQAAPQADCHSYTCVEM